MYTEGRKSKVPVDQQIVENNIHRAGGYVGAHSDFRVSGAALCGINTHLDTVKDHTAHDNPEVGNRAVMGFRRGTAQPYDRAGYYDKQDAQED